MNASKSICPDSLIIKGWQSSVGWQLPHLYFDVVIIMPKSPRTSVWLAFTEFKILTILAIGRKFNWPHGDGWVPGEEFARSNASRYLWLLKRSIQRSRSLQSWPVVENDRMGNYRLLIEPASIELSIPAFQKFDDYDLDGLLDRFCREMKV